MRRRKRETWRNHTGNQSCQPLAVCRPESLEDIVELVRTAEAERVTVRAVGSGHSWSDVGLTTGFLLEPHELRGPLPLERELLRTDERLVRVQGGTRIRELNEHLEEQGLALPNLGGYDGQTVAGVISTSTHGSGLGFGPLPELVRSLELVTSGGRLRRVEPSDGPTDRAAFEARHRDWELVQDDRLFNAAVVGIGCLGIVYGVTLAVRERFRLTEVRTATTWESVLSSSRLPPEGAEHWELFVNPYAREDGQHTCVVTSRTATPVGADPDADERRRPWLTEVLSSLPVTHGVLNLLLDLDPDGTPAALDSALERLADDEFTDRSYRVFNIGAANLLPAYSSEIGIPLEGDAPVRAVERIFAIAAQRARIGSAYQTSPFSLRFVRASPAYLSMMEGRDTMMIELIQQTDTEGGFELLAAYEDALYELGGRPHWGQVNALTGRAVRALYPRLDDWLAASAELNGSGVFDSPFGKRVGFSSAF
jgi:L-gulono-1,4-lactone dehydrogenase